MVIGTNFGAASELIVAVDLLHKGYEVYRAVVHTTSCDLAMGKRGGPLWRVEVKTALPSFKRDGTPRLGTQPNWGYFDVLAYVHTDGRIVYRPALEELVTG